MGREVTRPGSTTPPTSGSSMGETRGVWTATRARGNSSCLSVIKTRPLRDGKWKISIWSNWRTGTIPPGICFRSSVVLGWAGLAVLICDNRWHFSIYLSFCFVDFFVIVFVSKCLNHDLWNKKFFWTIFFLCKMFISTTYIVQLLQILFVTHDNNDTNINI